MGYSKVLQRKLFSPVMPSLQPSHREHSSPTIFTEALETACIVLESQMIENAEFFSFDTFPVEVCWFPSPKCFQIKFFVALWAFTGTSIPSPLTMAVLSSAEKQWMVPEGQRLHDGRARRSRFQLHPRTLRTSSESD